MNKISVDGKRFIDEYGRERIFYGINFGHKGFTMSDLDENFGSDNFLNNNIEYLKQHGLNIIRYFLNWSYLEPEPGKYNEKAFDDIKRFLDICEGKGMYVIIDMHQDLYSSFDLTAKLKKAMKAEKIPKWSSKIGDGAPEWACVTDGHSFRIPLFVWAEGYFVDKAVQHCFDNFWNNTKVNGKGLQDYFCDLWKEIAKRFADHPAVVGFDLFNEPYPGSDGGKIFRTLIKSVVRTTVTDNRIDKKKLLSSLSQKEPVAKILKQYNADILNTITTPCKEIAETFDKGKYSAFLNKVASAIRQQTDKGIIFFEHSYYSNLGIPFSSPAITVNGKREKNQAFAPHAYDFMVDTPLYRHADNNRVEAIFNQRRKEQKENLNMPVAVGEWGGGCYPYDWIPHAEFLLDLFDKYKWSHIYWCYNLQINNSPVMDMLCRAHPVAVCGEIIEYRFSKEEKKFTLRFRQDKEYDCFTEIFCHSKVKQIKTDGSYCVEHSGRYTSVLKIKTDIGIHNIEITF